MDVCKNRNQFGRSMIEMLGVLAIIAVLSMGGIAGYSKAMIKFKVNKTVEQVTNIVTEMMTIFTYSEQDINGEEGISSNDQDDLEVLEALGIITKSDIVNGEIKHPFGGKLSIWAAGGGLKEYEVDLYNLPREACLSLATIDWGNNSPNFRGIAINGLGGDPVAMDCSTHPFIGLEGAVDYNYVTVCKYRNSINSDGGEEIIQFPLRPDIAAKGCSCKKNICSLGLYYDDR